MSIFELFRSDCITGYSVMQSDWNTFCGDVVLDSVNKVSGDEDNIRLYIYKTKHVHIFNMNIFSLTLFKNAYYTIREALSHNFISSLLLSAVITQITQILKIFIIKIQKYLVYYAVFIPRCHVTAV